METTSQTPRTDANADIEEHGPFSPAREMVHASFARQLETELNEAKEALSGRTVSCSNCNAFADQLHRICKDGFDMQDTIGLEPADDYVLRQVEKMRDAMRQLYDMTEGYADGAPDASPHDRLCNEVAAKLQPFIK